jgi:hypothetical protein
MMACGVAGAAARAAAAGSVACGPSRAHTLAADSMARVYSRNGRVYGCARSGSKSYRLGTTSNSFDEGRAGPVVLAGTDAAYGLTFYGVDTVTAEVLVRRLTDGHVERQHSAINQPVGAEYFESVDDVVVKRNGSVAWIADATWIGSGGRRVVEVDKSDQTPRSLLDSRTSIDRQSLRLNGSRLSWRDGSGRHAAPLR